MRKVLFLILAIFSFSLLSHSADIDDWIKGDGTDAVEDGDNPGTIDNSITDYLQDPLDRLLSTYINGCTLTRTSATVITVSAGEVCCANGAGTIHRFRKNTSTTTMTITESGASGLDSGSSEGASTWYSIYAVADAEATTFTVIAAEDGAALSDVTYYKYLGSVYNDDGQDLANFTWVGEGNYCIFMFDVPLNFTTTLSAGSWHAVGALDIPSTSNMALLGLLAVDTNGNEAGVWVRPGSTTWATNNSNGIYISESGGAASVGGQRWCATDGSQQIQWYNGSGDESTRIDVEGFVINR